MRKRIRKKWDKLRGRTPTPEPEVGRPASAPPTTTGTVPIPSQSVIRPIPEPTSSSHPVTSRGTPQAPTGSPPTSAESPVTETSPLSTGVPPFQTPPDPHATTPVELPPSRNGTTDNQGGRVEDCPQTTKEGHSNVRDAVTSAVRLALDITESLSDGVPFLPGAVKALKTVMEAYEVCRLQSSVCSALSIQF